MRKIIDNKIVFDTEVKCSKCGERGAYDLTTEFLCGNCMPKWQPGSPQRDGSTALVVSVTGSDAQEAWSNLVSVVCAACASKQEHGGQYPLMISTNDGKIQTVQLNNQAQRPLADSDAGQKGKRE